MADESNEKFNMFACSSASNSILSVVVVVDILLAVDDALLSILLSFSDVLSFDSFFVDLMGNELRYASVQTLGLYVHAIFYEYNTFFIFF